MLKLEMLGKIQDLKWNIIIRSLCQDKLLIRGKYNDQRSPNNTGTMQALKVNSSLKGATTWFLHQIQS